MDGTGIAGIVTGIIFLIVWIPMTIALWNLYHKLFTRIYFGNGCAAVLGEIGGCALLAFFICSMIYGLILGVIQGAVSLLGAILAIIIKIIVFIIKVAVLSAIIYGIYYLVMELKKRRSPEVDFPNQEKSEAVIGIAIIIALVVVGITSCFGRTDKNDSIEKENQTVKTEFVFPDSDKRYLDENDVKGLSQTEIKAATYEICAREGMIFENEKLNQYYSSRSWYEPKYTQEEFWQKVYQVLNEYERANLMYLVGLWEPQEGVKSEAIGQIEEKIEETVEETTKMVENETTQQIVEQTSEQATEETAEETTEDPFNRSDLYGIFELHNDWIDASAEIGYYTSEDGGGYLMLDGATSDGSATGSFYGSLVSASGDHFWAQNEDGGSVEFILYEDSIEIISDEGSEGGMNFPGFTGTYIKTGELTGG